jgi:hypothetical protein
MAQTESLTTQGLTEAAKCIGGVTSTGMTKAGGLKTSCTANTSQNYAGVTWCTESGLTLAAATTTITGAGTDTVQLDHVFTAGEVATVKGFGCANTDGDVLFSLCCFAADVVMAASDTLTVQMKHQVTAV